MTDDKRKLEPALKLDMDFGEALKRFAATKPAEVADSIERSKAKKKPPRDKPPAAKSGCAPD
ncbi:hypothetical protein NKJ86_04910 [Mesorhizobium sp. M0025]|uniref:hypothetical protein n=1 Tax=unclassified Mesorhizobium TaxID=325217 RepID=UPI00333B5761